VGGFKDVIQCPAGVRGRGDPAGAGSAEEAPRNAHGCSLLERKSTTKFNRAFYKVKKPSYEDRIFLLSS
jgi:hypothetical protein